VVLWVGWGGWGVGGCGQGVWGGGGEWHRYLVISDLLVF